MSKLIAVIGAPPYDGKGGVISDLIDTVAEDYSVVSVENRQDLDVALASSLTAVLMFNRDDAARQVFFYACESLPREVPLILPTVDRFNAELHEGYDTEFANANPAEMARVVSWEPEEETLEVVLDRYAKKHPGATNGAAKKPLPAPAPNA